MTDYEDAYRRMEARLATPEDDTDTSDATPWKPWTDASEPKAMVGRLVRVADLPERDGMPAAILAVIDPRGGGGLRSLVVRHAALALRWNDQAPAVGDLVGVVYRGQATTNAGRQYHAWHLEVERVEPSAEPVPANGRKPADDDIPF